MTRTTAEPARAVKTLVSAEKPFLSFPKKERSFIHKERKEGRALASGSLSPSEREVNSVPPVP